MNGFEYLIMTNRILRYIADMFPGVVLAAALFLCLLPWRKRRLAARGLKSAPLREAVLLLFWMFCGGMAVLLLTPRWLSWWSILMYGPPQGVTAFSPGSVNLIPFQTLGQVLYIFLGNIVMFIPFGLFAGLLFRGFGWNRALLTGLCITAFIECWQLCVGRAFDVDDLMLNTLGVFCGFLTALAVRRLFPRFAAKLLVTSSD